MDINADADADVVVVVVVPLKMWRWNESSHAVRLFFLLLAMMWGWIGCCGPHLAPNPDPELPSPLLPLPLPLLLPLLLPSPLLLLLLLVLVLVLVSRWWSIGFPLFLPKMMNLGRSGPRIITFHCVFLLLMLLLSESVPFKSRERHSNSD